MRSESRRRAQSTLAAALAAGIQTEAQLWSLTFEVTLQALKVAARDLERLLQPRRRQTMREILESAEASDTRARPDPAAGAAT